MKDIKKINPINYKLCLEIDVNKTDFYGKVDIKLELKELTKNLTLHCENLKIKDIKLNNPDIIDYLEFEINPKNKTMQIDLKKEFQGTIELSIDYEGKIHEDLLGIYRSAYDTKKGKKYVVVTQFEEIFARRAFPCIDHPSKKATFDINFIIDEELIGISNSPVKSTTSIEKGKKLIEFEQTPKMCTYLLFFGVGDFEIIEKKTEKHNVRLITTPGKTKYGELGLNMAFKSLTFLEEFISIDYPIGKCDVIAVPDFQFGAMENWGAILFRETLLLVYPDKTSKMGIFNVGSVVAHEVSHFWFGNLVSPSDWKYIWLNESFASYFTYAIPDHYYPEWHSWEHFIAQYYISSLERDCLINTFPVELLDDSEVFITPAKVGIVYDKGSAVLRMLASYLGLEAFKKGIKSFMKKYQFNISNSKQYWETFEEATNAPVKEFEDSWIHQPGYPLVEVKKQGNQLILIQKRFTIIEHKSKETWLIPLKIIFFKENGETETKSISFKTESEEIHIALKVNHIALKVNSGQTGFYRVKYDQVLLKQLEPLIKDKKLSAIDRFGIQNDLFALLLRGDYTIAYYLDFIQNNYINEEDYLPLASLFPNLIYIHTLKKHLRNKIEQLGLKITKGFFTHYGYEQKSEEPMTVSILRNFLLWTSYSMGCEEAKEFGLKKFEELRVGKNVSPDLLSSIYKIALIENKTAKEFLIKKLESPETPQVELRYIYDALGSVKEKVEILESLQIMLEKVPPQTWFAVLYRLGQNELALDLLWHWFKENLEMLEKQNPFVLGRAIAALIPMGGLLYKEEVEEFFKNYQKKNQFQKDTIEMVLEQLEINDQFKKRD